MRILVQAILLICLLATLPQYCNILDIIVYTKFLYYTYSLESTYPITSFIHLLLCLIFAYLKDIVTKNIVFTMIKADYTKTLIKFTIAQIIYYLLPNFKWIDQFCKSDFGFSLLTISFRFSQGFLINWVLKTSLIHNQNNVHFLIGSIVAGACNPFLQQILMKYYFGKSIDYKVIIKGSLLYGSISLISFGCIQYQDELQKTLEGFKLKQFFLDIPFQSKENLIDFSVSLCFAIWAVRKLHLTYRVKQIMKNNIKKLD